MMYIHPALIAKIVAHEALSYIDIDYDGNFISSPALVNEALSGLELNIDYLGIDDAIYDLIYLK